MPALSESNYNIKPIIAPLITGPLLVFITFLIEYIPGVAYLLGKDSGLFDLRKQQIDETPTYFPMDIESFQEYQSKNIKTQSIKEVLLLLKDDTLIRRVHFTSRDYIDRYSKKHITPTLVAEEFIQWIQQDELNPNGLQPMDKYDVEDIRHQALESTSRYASGKPLGPLDGVLVAIKDENDVEKFSTDCGSIVNRIPKSDATVVSKLRKAGAIIVGKTKMNEFGLDVTGCNPNAGTARNAYNRNHWPGGSSSGSGAIVGANLCPIAIGNDGGGSIRIPASFNGVYGLKTTAGRISGAGCFPLATTVGVVGPIASSAYDLALSYSILAGPDHLDTHSILQPFPSLTSYGQIKSLVGLKLGVYWEYFSDCDPEIIEACKKSLAKFEALGATIVEIDIPFLNEIKNSHSITITSEILSATAHFQRSKMTYPTRIALGIFQTLKSVDFLNAAKIRTRGMNIMRDVFRKVDAIVTPTNGITSSKIPSGALSYGISDYTTSGQVMKYAFLANNLGIPALTCPVGYDSKGMPIGIQFQAKWYNEDLLLRLAHASEKAHEQILKAPENAANLLKKSK